MKRDGMPSSQRCNWETLAIWLFSSLPISAYRLEVKRELFKRFMSSHHLIKVMLGRVGIAAELGCDVGVYVWGCWSGTQLEAAIYSSSRQCQVSCYDARSEPRYSHHPSWLISVMCFRCDCLVPCCYCSAGR